MQLNKEQNYLSIVVVINHDAKDIDQFFLILQRFCEQNFNSYEFVIVDNNALRETIDKIINKLIDMGLYANLIGLPYEFNKEQAVLAGVDAAVGDYVFEFEDTTVDYIADDLWRMYQTCKSGNDIVLLRPNYQTRFLEREFYRMLVKYSNKESVLYQSRVHLISRRAINRANSCNKVIYYRKYAYCNLGLNYTFIMYESSRRQKSSELTWGKIDYATDLLLVFTNLGKRISIVLSLVFMLTSIIAIIYTIFAYALLNVIHGWTTIMLLLSISFTGVFICFGIVIKYLNLLLANQQKDDGVNTTKRRIS
jgi:hypothetical protein